MQRQKTVFVTILVISAIIVATLVTLTIIALMTPQASSPATSSSTATTTNQQKTAPTTSDNNLIDLVSQNVFDTMSSYTFNSLIRVDDAGNSYYFIVASISDQFETMSNASFVVYQDDTGSYSLVAGVGDSFTSDELLSYDVPKASVDKIVKLYSEISPQQEDTQ